jgi:hypothetical protein
MSNAEVIRRAIREFRRARSEHGLVAVLRETAGTWTSLKGDGRAHVDALREEWEGDE